MFNYRSEDKNKSDKSAIYQKYVRRAMLCKNGGLDDEIIGMAVICEFYR